MHSIVKCPAAHSGKNEALCQVPLRWRGAAQRRGGQRDQERATPLSLRAQRGNPFNKKSPKRAIFYYICCML